MAEYIKTHATMPGNLSSILGTQMIEEEDFQDVSDLHTCVVAFTYPGICT